MLCGFSLGWARKGSAPVTCSEPLPLSPVLSLAPCSGSIQKSSGTAQATSYSFAASLGITEGSLCGTAFPCPSGIPVSSLHPVFVGLQAESKQVGQSIFRRSLLNRLQQEYKDREELRTRSLQAWICYVTFICNIFDYLRVNNMPMMALVNPVYDCLFRLAQPDSLQKEEEVDCLVLQLHRIGEQLEKMNSQRMDELFSLLRDGFLLQEGLSSLSQLLLLEIIEFRAAEWKMTDAAQKYYYSEVTD
uniref:MIF4G domain containing n=1 Tax=Zonotrichia albicollis TaxID=44394 RepID=A0A8D2N829_ZONAL